MGSFEGYENLFSVADATRNASLRICQCRLDNIGAVVPQSGSWELGMLRELLDGR
jgi:hypothetical protein